MRSMSVREVSSNSCARRTALQICNAVLRAQLFEDTSLTDIERIQYFSDKAGFWRGITEEDCTPVEDNLGQNFSRVTTRLYGKMFDLITSEDARSRNIR